MNLAKLTIEMIRQSVLIWT